MVLSNSMLIPVLPALQRGLNISLFKAGLLITAFSVVAGLVIPLAGIGSDYWGRKTVMVPALFLFGLGGLVAGLAPVFFKNAAYPVIIAGRIIQGVGGGGTYQVALALAGDIFQSKERSKVMGLLEAANGLGKVISPILGAALGIINWYVPFFAYPALAWASAAGLWLVVREPKEKAQPRSLSAYRKDLQEVFAGRGLPLAAAFASGAVVLFMLFGVLSWYSDVLEKDYHITGIVKGLVIAIPVLVLSVTAWLGGTTLQHHLSRWLRATVMAGLALGAAALAGLIFARGIYWVTAALVLLGFGNGLVLPTLNTGVTSSAGESIRGLVTALYGTVRFFGAALGPPAFGLMVDMGVTLTFALAAGLLAAVGVMVFFWLDQKKLLPPEMAKAGKARQPKQRRAKKVRPVGPLVRLGNDDDG